MLYVYVCLHIYICVYTCIYMHVHIYILPSEMKTGGVAKWRMKVVLNQQIKSKQ